MSDERREHFLEMVEQIGVAAATTVTYTCPQGCTARIVGAWAYHDHAAGSNCQFLVNNGASSKEVGPPTAVASTTGRHSLYTNAEMCDGLILHPGWSLIAYAAAIAGGEHVYMTRIVELRKGEPSDG